MVRRVFGNLYFLTFLNGFLLASLFYFKMEADFEKELFSAIRSDVDYRLKHTDSQDSVVVKVMHASHNLMATRGPVFEGKTFGGFKSDIIDPTSIDLMTARGACGSYSTVLARLLKGYGYPIRIAQMKSDGVFAAHNIVEVETGHGWVVLDPLYDLYFVQPSGKLASFADVKNDWNYYQAQLPAGYDRKYRYEDVRYSNWTKIPVIFPAVKKILDLTLGKEKADNISMRIYFLRKYNLFVNGIAILLVLVMSYTLVRLIKAKIFPRQNIPITFPNLLKYVRRRFTEKPFREHGQA